MKKKFRSKLNSDRISDLPEAIRLHILAFLPTSDAVRTSILSSSWRESWTELPALKLRDFELNKLLRVSDLHKDVTDRLKWESIVRKREEFYRFLDRALESRLELKELSLHVPGYVLALKSRVDHWVDSAVVRGVQELELNLGVWDFANYSLPKSVFGVNSSIAKLNLLRCELHSSSLVDAWLPSLRKLTLDHVNLDEGVFGSLPANCPNIEVLDIISCHGFTKLVISGLMKLIELDIYSGGESEIIEIEAPNLLEFTYTNENYMEECELKVLACKNLSYLMLHGAPLSDNDLNHFLENLPVLVRLELLHCNRVKHVRVSSEHLVHLEFIDCIRLLKAEIDSPNLKTFRYREDEVISFRPKGSALKLTEASISLTPYMAADKWYVVLVKFLKKLCHCEVLTLDISSEEKELILPKKVRMKYQPPLHGVKKLIVVLMSEQHIRVKLVETLLWLAPCLESLSIYNEYISDCKIFKFTYERPGKGNMKCGCWNSLAINCWRHALTEVSIEKKKRDEDDTELANFFSKARIDGKMVRFVKNPWPETS
ncbi:F-box/FBD/LRR-repeat protein At2g04230 isoform X1 [Beta vulgaris subsp. vulgaris]|uniref:F-box/FBD/LRR-repeat protein At2g04230 isoform X1 n=1 Tax=Beta vulgaris subsp. vulgaris TaxID=3555 RepID=UPI0020373EE4|nr:F-box/FBD/LRR-repeat protein At2g04230 isoform X1 [Beta vulgaris subsp. vulgaris]